MTDPTTRTPDLDHGIVDCHWCKEPATHTIRYAGVNRPICNNHPYVTGTAQYPTDPLAPPTPNSPDPIECAFCNLTSPDVGSAIDDGWIPSYWGEDTEGEDYEVSNPVCPNCQDKHLRFIDGEYSAGHRGAGCIA